LCTSTVPRGDSERAKQRLGSGRRDPAAGGARTSTSVAALVDTNILVYRFDPRFRGSDRPATNGNRRRFHPRTAPSTDRVRRCEQRSP
jgi:hypothetical protein